MKKLFLSAVFLLVCILSHAQGNSEKEDFFLPEAPGKVLADLGEIPGWVKDRVSDEEYRILKDASPWFKLDYTFLYRENNSDSRSKVFSRLKTTVAEIEKGTYVDSLGLGPLYGYVGFSMTQNIDRSREWELESYIRMADGVFFAGKKTRIRIDSRCDGGVELTVWYMYDTNTGTADPLYASVTGIQGKVNYSAADYYDEEADEVVVSVVGRLIYFDDNGKICSTDFSGSLAFKPELL